MTTATASNVIPPAPRWDLDSVFAGGSASPEFKAFREKTKTKLDKAEQSVSGLSAEITDSTSKPWVDFVVLLQELHDDIELIISFANCLTSQNVDDSEGNVIMGEGDALNARLQKLVTELEARSLKQSDAAWKQLTQHPAINDVAFYLQELRQIAKRKLPLEQEGLALDLAVDGFHAWNRLYDKMAGDLRVDFQENGTSRSISLGQLATKLSDADRAVRKQAFEKLTGAWETRAELAAMTLNSIGGFRLTLHHKRGWKSPLDEPLMMTRMKQETLDAMWRVIQREAPRLQAYINAKKKLAGIDKFSWYDVFAPVGSSESKISYDDAASFIVKHTRPFSAHMADFFEHALNRRWVEAEDRPGKRGGGYCTGLGPVKESRIFMTYANTFENLLTLAHELGHAYHSYVLNDRQRFATQYPMNLAETASIFAETLVLYAALEKTTARDEKLMLLDQQLQGALTLLCDIQCRYLFDRQFYEERQKGLVPRERLCQIMIDAQKKAFAGMLDESGYHPLFWCSKLHFYLSDVPFYNYPYTFGYLFAVGVYDRASKEGSAFADKYRALLNDTGSMTTEEVAQKHLGIDLTQDAFWTSAVSQALAPIDEFVKLANEK